MERKQRLVALVLKMSVSLDGYVAPPDGSTEWAAAGRSPDGASWTLETVSNAGAHLMGATTYAGWAGFWPNAPGPFAKPMNHIPKVVFSDSLESADWAGTTIVSGDLTDAVTRLKQQQTSGYLLAQGGAGFARSLCAGSSTPKRLDQSAMHAMARIAHSRAEVGQTILGWHADRRCVRPDVVM